MTYSYFIDGQDNQCLFQYIQVLNIPANNILPETPGQRIEIKHLFQRLHKGDILIIKSIIALGDNLNQIVKALDWLNQHKVELISVVEDYYSNEQFEKFIHDLFTFDCELNKKARLVGYEKALASGKVGRPKASGIEKALELYDSKRMTVEQIQKITSVSTSTLYRAIRDRQKRS